MQAIQKNYPDIAPQQVISRYAEIDGYVKRAPAEGAGWIYQQTTGRSPLELARQITAAHSPAEVQQHYQMRDAEVTQSGHVNASRVSTGKMPSSPGNRAKSYGRNAAIEHERHSAHLGNLA